MSWKRKSAGAKTKGPKEGVVLLIDVGEAVGEVDITGQSFLEKSKKCASRIVQRKIFSNANDQFTLALIGSENTENDLNYPNIKVQSKYFSSPNWILLREIQSLSVSNPDSSNSDWLDGLIVAVDLLKNESECKGYSVLKIVLMSNFAAPVRSKEQVDDLIDALKELKINLVVIGPESEDEDNSETEVKTKVQRKGEAIIGRIVEEADGVICGFSEAMAQLGHYQPVTAKPAPWYSNLEIGKKISIPIVGYKKFDSKKFLSWKKKSVDRTPITQEWVNFEGDEQLEKGDVINSYPFGQTLIPFSEDDKSSISLETEKCFQLIGFTKMQNVPRHMLLGDSVLYILPKMEIKGAVKAVQALAKVLLEKKMAGIVRRVYCKNSAPRIGALVTTVENDIPYLYWVQLPFAEDERRLKLPSLQKIKPTQEQLDAVDNLIDSMDLSQLDEDEDIYEKPMNPVVEHMNNLITFKALNPSSKLPTEPLEAIQNLLRPIPEILENAREALDTIKKLFTLEEVEQKTYRRGAAEIFNRSTNNGSVSDNGESDVNIGSITNFVQSTVTEVGTVDPEGNFLKLLEQGEPFGNVCKQMQTAIKKLILTSSSSVGEEKSISALKLLRQHCVVKNPAAYNMFIASLKDDLVQRENTELWNIIVQERLGLVTSEESQQSTVSADEAEVFYEMKKFESQSEANYEMEAEDLLDEL